MTSSLRPPDVAAAFARNPRGAVTSRRRSLWTRPLPLYSLVVAIVIADGLTAAGIVVGILLAVPILLSSAGGEPRLVLHVSGAALMGFVLAAFLGAGPVSPEAVWLPNRVFAMVTIVASAVIALRLQKRRLEAESARREAESARDLNRLLHSLMAHDLRSPLALGRQAIEAVQGDVRAGAPVDLPLLAEVDARLGRSLRTIQLVLESARAELSPGSVSATPMARVDIAGDLREEVESFTQEAGERGKALQLEVPPAGLPARVDAAVLRQSVAILLDNALRYAVPGPVRVSATSETGELRVSVRDSGPGLARSRTGAAKGEGLGLRLCQLLVQRAGGTLEVASDDESGTEFVLRLPA